MCVPEKFLFAKYSGSINKGCKPILFKKFYFSNFNDLFSNCDFTYCKNLYPLISVVLLFLNPSPGRYLLLRQGFDRRFGSSVFYLIIFQKCWRSVFQQRVMPEVSGRGEIP